MSTRLSDVEALAKVLGAHGYAIGLRRGSICTCGHVPAAIPESLMTQQDYHREHIATILAARLAEAEQAAERRGTERVLAAVEALADEYEGLGDYIDDPKSPLLTSVRGLRLAAEHLRALVAQQREGGD